MVAAILVLGFKLVIRKLYPIHYRGIVIQCCEDFNVEPTLVFAIINCESRFDKNAHSKADARGLMQLTEETFVDMGKLLKTEHSFNVDAFEPNVNITYGIKYISWLLNYYNGDKLAVIASYNAGLGNVNAWMGDDKKLQKEEIRFAETRNYVNKVQSAEKYYKYLYF